MVVQRVRTFDDIEVTVDKVKNIMKDEFGLKYRISKNIPTQANRQRCLVLRQQYAVKMLELMREGKRIINIDESWFNETNFTRQIWCPANSTATVPLAPVTHRLSLIAALDTEGRIY